MAPWIWLSHGILDGLMHAQTLNIVYRYLPEEVIDADPLGAAADNVIWSRSPREGADIVVYYNHFSDTRERRPGNARQLLFNTEPVVVLPGQWMRSCWERYDGVLSWNRCLVAESSHFTYCPVISYDKPWPHPFGIPRISDSRSNWLERERAMVTVIGGKASLTPWNLYGYRKQLANTLCDADDIRLDVYGRPPLRVRRHCGEAPDKLGTMERYQFALVTENCLHPRWSKGYLTEKLFDALAAGCLPLYLGCSNLEEEFPGAPVLQLPGCIPGHALKEFLAEVPEARKRELVEHIPTALASQDPTKRYSVRNLYDAALHAPESDRDYPKDCLESAPTPMEMLRLKTHDHLVRLYHKRRVCK